MKVVKRKGKHSGDIPLLMQINNGKVDENATLFEIPRD